MQLFAYSFVLITLLILIILMSKDKIADYYITP
jgi:hypothetical protein